MRRLIRTIAGATAMAMLAASPASAEWREASTDHFLIYADSSESWLRGFAERLERFDQGMRRLRDLEAPPGTRSNRLTIYVVSSPDAVQKLCGARCGNVAGFYVPRAGGSIAFTPRRMGGFDVFGADIVLFHEYVHHFMLENYAAAYPRWFIEGFAEFNSTADVNDDGSIQFGRPAQHRAHGLLKLRPMPIEQLLDPGQTRMDRETQEVFYARAWLLTHMLTFEPSRAKQLSAYLKLINQGKPSLEAARAAFGDLDALQRDMNVYLRRRTMLALTLKADETEPGAIALRELTPGEAATMAVRMRSDRGVNRAQALDLLPEARKRAAEFPADAAAQTMLAEAEYDAGNDAECLAAADRALATDPKRRDALLYKGRARLRMAQVAGATDPAVWKEARSWFVKANRNDPNAAEPLMMFYSSFLAAREKPSDSAVLGLQRAFELSPHDGSLRMMLVRQLLLDSKPAEARVVLLPLAYDPHAAPDNPAIRLVALIDRGLKGPAVVTALDQERKPPEGL